MEPRPKRRTSTEAEAEPRQLLPDDVVLEIVARCPAIADVIRCAAVSKPIRRGILHAPFLRRLRGFLIRRDDGEHSHPPVRNLLVGLYRHQIGDPHRPPAFVPARHGAADLPPPVAALPPAPDGGGGGGCEFGPYRPVASRRSLLVLRRRCRNLARDHLVVRHGPHPVELTVCNPTTGERRVLPPHDVPGTSVALLDVDPIAAAPSSSFKLLAAELSTDGPSTLYAQIFSSEAGEWGPRLACPVTSRLAGHREGSCELAGAGCRHRPAVVGDAIHWLCTTDLGDRVLKWRWRWGDGGVARAASILKVPSPYRLGWPEKRLAALPSTGGAAGSPALLGMIVLVRGEIEVWAREKAGAGPSMAWKLWRRVMEASIPRPTNSRSGWLGGAELWWFCEDSGTLLLRPGNKQTMSSPLLLDLESLEVSELEAEKWEQNPEPELWPYEVDLLSYMLFLMKRF